MPRIILWTATNCVKCPAAKKIFKETANELNLVENKDYEIKNIDDEEVMIEALQNNVASTPSLTIDGELIYNGEIPERNFLLQILKNNLKL